MHKNKISKNQKHYILRFKASRVSIHPYKAAEYKKKQQLRNQRLYKAKMKDLIQKIF
jgi:hypothetical protein